MQFTTAFLASAAALTATAMPQTTPISGTDRFQVITIRSGSPIQNAPLQAAQRHLFVGVKSQNATCDTRDEVNSATFYISNEELVLHSRHPSPQTIYVDRSGMGMGNVGYVTGAEPLGRNWETKGWALTETNELQFDGTGIQACPNSIDGGWGIWLQGNSEPGYNKDCLSVTAAAYKVENPIGCRYTQE